MKNEAETALPRTFFKGYSMVPAPSPGDWTGCATRPHYCVYDLGPTAATAGELAGRFLRFVGPDSFESAWMAHDLDFHFIYIYTGSVTIEFSDGSTHALNVGDTALIPGGFRYRETQFSSDCQIFELTSPSDAPTLTGESPKGNRSRIIRKSCTSPIITQERPDAYVVGDGPRKFFAYRDFGLSEVTEGGVHIQLVRPVARPPGGTGLHYHSMGQFALGITGVANLRLGDCAETKILPGWGLSLPPGYQHDAWDFSMDYGVLEACFPAEYQTVAV